MHKKRRRNALRSTVRVLRLLKGFQEFRYSKLFDTGSSKYSIPYKYLKKFEENKDVGDYIENSDNQNKVMSFHHQERILKKILLEFQIKRLVNILSGRFFDNISIFLFDKYKITTNIEVVDPRVNFLKKNYDLIYGFFVLIFILSILTVYMLYIGVFVSILLLILNQFFPSFLFDIHQILKKNEFAENYSRIKDDYDLDVKVVNITFTRNRCEKVTVKGILFGEVIQILPQNAKLYNFRSSFKLVNDIEEILRNEIYSISLFD